MSKRTIEAVYALSPMQQGMLFHSLYAPESGVYVEQLSCTLRGNLDVAAFERAWQRVLERHAILRTTFVWKNLDKMLQVVQRQVPLPFEYQDWRGLAPVEQAARLEGFLQADRTWGFDVSQAPLLRLALLRTAADAYYFVWSFHHALLDGWSLPILMHEVFTLYEAFARQQEATLPPVRPYRDYITWLQQQDLQAAEAFWRRTLAGFSAPTPLVVDQPAQKTDAAPVQYDERATRLPVELTATLQTLARRHQVTMNTLAQGAWALLLSRYSDEEDVVFGATVSGRPADLPDVERMVGLFINTLPVRVRVPPATPVLTWLQELHAQQAEARQYEYTPLAQIQGWSEVPRSLPLFESIFIFENYPVDSLARESTGGLEIQNFRAVEQTNYPLAVVSGPGAELVLKMSYDCRRFDAPTIARMLGHLHTILAGFAAAPHQPLASVPLLTEAEHQQLLVEWNATAAPYAHDQCIHQLIEAQVARTPAAVAVVFEETSLTYAALNTRANQLAHYLQHHGVGPDTLVALALPPSLDLVVAVLGVLKAGGAFLPLDPAAPPARQAFMLADARPPVLLTHGAPPAQAGAAPGGPPAAAPACVVRLDTDWSAIAQAPATPPARPVTPDHLAYVIYTSGSTGQPKGTLLTHRGLVNFTQALIQRLALTPADRVLQVAALSFDAAVSELTMALAAGATLVLAPPATRTAPEALLALLRSAAISCVTLPPALLAVLPPTALPALRTVIAAGERCPWDIAQRWAPGRRFFNGYGPTEATIGTTYHLVTQLDQPTASVPIGRPIANTQIYLLDRHQQPVPIGVPGELYIGGVGLARGYLHRPELTAATFVPNPFAARARGRGEHSSAPPPQRPTPPRLYRTGDRARYLPDGNLEFLDRLDHQVKLRGFRIELGEIEALLRQHPAVQDAVVLARADTPGDKRLVAYVIPPDPAGTPSPAQLRAFLAERLPDYMLPAAFVALEGFPLTPSGKVDRRALPAPDGQRPDLPAAYVAPRTPVEELLAGLWGQVLGLDRVGIHDSFFALGGHSLLATRIIARVREVFQVELPLRSLFDTPTVAGLAAQIQASHQVTASRTAPPIAPVPRDGGLPLSFAQQRLWFLDQLEPDSPLYNNPAAVRISGALDVAALARSLTTLSARHEPLRTRVVTVDGQPRQVITPAAALAAASTRLPVRDLRHLPPDARASEALRLAQAEAAQPFDLAHGPLLRTGLLRLDDTEYIFLLTMHHIIADGWSIGMLIQELATLYAGFTTGQPAELADLPIQYADFAVWQRAWLQGEVLEDLLGYWSERLRNSPPMLALPTDQPRPAIQTFRGATCSFTIPQPLSDAVKALSRQEGTTLFMTLLAAFQVLLYRYSGQEDICVGTPIANRTRAEVEPLIGCFINTLVLRCDLSGDPAFRDLLQQVREVALGAYAHQDLPFEMLVDALQPARDLSHSPLFQVMLTLNNTPAKAIELPDLTISAVEADSKTSQFDLSLQIAEGAAGLSAALEYNTDLFAADTIERMARHFQTLLAGIVADPEERISTLPLLTEAERRQLLVEWNATAAPYPHDRCFHHLFEEQVARTPDTPAVVYEDQQLTYHELNARANQLAHYLQHIGITPDTLVGVCVERSPELIIGILGILKAGGAYVPLDPTYPPDRLAFMLADTQAPVLLTHATLDAGRWTTGDRPRVPAQAGTDHEPRTTNDARPGSAQRPIVVQIDADWPTIACQPTTNPASPVMPEHLAYVIYTSGSTGQPKGVMISHRNVLNLATGLQRAIYAHHPAPRPLRATLNAPIAFDASVQQLTLLLHGHTLYILPEQVRRDAPALRDYLHHHAIDVLDCVPTHLKLLLAAGLLTGAGRVPSLILPGGEALDPATWHTLAQTSAATTCYNLYGPTECTVDATTSAVSAAPAHPTIGRPLANVQLYVLDPHQQPVPIGVPGELYIGGAGVARGYWNRPELTAATFVPNPFARGAMGRWGDAELERCGDPPPHRPTAPPPHRPTPSRLYRTGDRVRYRPDGTLEFLGRLDHQVKLRGFRIELGEIEALLQHHPAVQEAVAVVREDRPGDPRLVAYVVVTPGPGAGGDEPPTVNLQAQLRAFLSERLPDYMVPATFVELNDWPRSPSGKIDRRALPAPDGTRPDLKATYVAPRTPTEETLTALCAELLGIERVGINDNFFDLGGHSLLATRFIARIRDALQVELPLRELFEHPTVAGLAARITEDETPAAAAPAPAITARPRAAHRRKRSELADGTEVNETETGATRTG